MSNLIQEILDEENNNSYYNTLSPAAKKRIEMSTRSMQHGLHTTAPITCRGLDKCPFKEHCPIPDRNNKGEMAVFTPPEAFPLNRACVLESVFAKQKLIYYLQFLEVQDNDPIELSLVNDLVLIDLYKNRAMMILSNGDRDDQGRDFLRVDFTETTENGTPGGTSTQLHPLMTFLEKNEKRRITILEKFNQTRQAKDAYKLKVGGLVEKDNQVEALLKMVGGLLKEAQKTKAYEIEETIELRK